MTTITPSMYRRVTRLQELLETDLPRRAHYNLEFLILDEFQDGRDQIAMHNAASRNETGIYLHHGCMARAARYMEHLQLQEGPRDYCLRPHDLCDFDVPGGKILDWDTWEDLRPEYQLDRIFLDASDLTRLVVDEDINEVLDLMDAQLHIIIPKRTDLFAHNVKSIYWAPKDAERPGSGCNVEPVVGR